METQLNYGNWIRKKILLILGICALGIGVLSLLPFGSLYQLAMAFLFVMTFISFLFPVDSYVMFSQNGGHIQDKVYNLIIQHLGLPITGRILDIGSGNGVLAVKLAQQHDEAEVVGMDYWGKEWEYSKGACDKNARIGGVENRVHFQKGDAAALEFASDTFDGAVNNLTFHEVRSVADKREVVREALRVVKDGGRFAFVDYFYNAKHYGTAAEFENYLRSLNLPHFEIKPLREMIELPLLLRHPKILGQVGIVYGRK
ncbi:MAG TPA: class I SAM-dependent methyltransferase [Blastocatellia bacterium]|nr:class I SAM-dependent methyltransferase [Blastocatellia bacterium]